MWLSRSRKSQNLRRNSRKSHFTVYNCPTKSLNYFRVFDNPGVSWWHSQYFQLTTPVLIALIVGQNYTIYILPLTVCATLMLVTDVGNRGCWWHCDSIFIHKLISGEKIRRNFDIDYEACLFDFVLTYAILTPVTCRFWEVFWVKLLFPFTPIWRF